MLLIVETLTYKIYQRNEDNNNNREANVDVK